MIQSTGGQLGGPWGPSPREVANVTDAVQQKQRQDTTQLVLIVLLVFMALSMLSSDGD